ncbi:DUF938 domain-containing protein [Antarcticimicrobium luteum]|uniref:DUF938 domain-containing protein n=1 Tax=Antarcticimicrobium luteum TaxID=2547397 RepID=A0A4R5UX20_9RHOB|nr:DUF938 domain-containing protein [Antarcticimicrobium luteum]TDK43860.1 DUF938 domain-containing protein [Antarcticimicrobium luteum]
MTDDARKTEIASHAVPGEGDKLIAPSAERNLAPICDLLAHVAPTSGKALEIASGTGQHVAAFAARFPDLHWQPSEPDAARRASIDAYAAESGCPNIAPALALDAARPGWGAELSGQNLITLCNLLHLIPMERVEVLIAEAARALAPGGRLVIYGPFMRAGELTSEGDAAFHASLTAQDPRIGYKDDFDVIDLMQEAGLELAEVVEMPANNLALIAQKPAF